MEATALLHDDLDLAAHAAAAPRLALALAAADPLRLDLPPLPRARVAPEALHALSALYLAARLEETGLPLAAEWLVRERATLRVPPATAARLDADARLHDREYPRERRLALFARLFGLGDGVRTEPGGSHARFEPLLGALCSALVTCGARPAGTPDGPHVAVLRAGLDLAEAAGLVYGGGVALAVAPINDGLRRAVALLTDPGIEALAATRGLWPTLQRLLGTQAPDLRRLLDCGRHGQRVLRWLATVAPGLDQSRPVAPPVASDAVTSAAAWLTACGLPPRAPGSGSV